jgi:hypothetical protein
MTIHIFINVRKYIVYSSLSYFIMGGIKIRKEKGEAYEMPFDMIKNEVQKLSLLLKTDTVLPRLATMRHGLVSSNTRTLMDTCTARLLPSVRSGFSLGFYYPALPKSIVEWLGCQFLTVIFL